MIQTKRTILKTNIRKIHLNINGAKLIILLTMLCVFNLMTVAFVIVATNYNLYIYIAFVTVLLIFIASLGWSYKKLYLPHKRLEESLKSFNLSNDSKFLKNINICYSAEMGKFVSHLFSLVESMNTIKMTNVNAEYRALQNQINPHFLYNTLEAIRSDAICNGVNSIADISEALATFFRYTISNINSLVPLEAELNNTETYFIIQKFRFGDKINLQIDLNEDDILFLDFKIPKLTLQPIVENAIVHGLERKLGIGTVQIKITTIEGKLIITVRDDGIGMDETILNKIGEQLNEILAKNLIPNKTDKEGIGLINVNSRLKLMFGEEYGLRINSIKNFGTCVYITLPLVKKVT